MNSGDDVIVTDIKRLRDIGFKWKDVGNALNICPSTLYRLRKKVRYDDMPENRSIGNITVCIKK